MWWSRNFESREGEKAKYIRHGEKKKKRQVDLTVLCTVDVLMYSAPMELRNYDLRH
jgi:hypothetical protein